MTGITLALLFALGLMLPLALGRSGRAPVVGETLGNMMVWVTVALLPGLGEYWVGHSLAAFLAGVACATVWMTPGLRQRSVRRHPVMLSVFLTAALLVTLVVASMAFPSGVRLLLILTLASTVGTALLGMRLIFQIFALVPRRRRTDPL